MKFDLTIKARLVTGVHWNKDILIYTIYSMMIYRESGRMRVLILAIYDLYIIDIDIENTYINT